MDFSGRVRSGFSWNPDSSMMVLGLAEPMEHSDRISLSAGTLHKSKDVYPACGGSLDWKVHLQSCSHVCLPANPPTSSRATALTTSKPPRNSAGLSRFTQITGWALLSSFFPLFCSSSSCDRPCFHRRCHTHRMEGGHHGQRCQVWDLLFLQQRCQVCVKST